jgi:hypothetical protein
MYVSMFYVPTSRFKKKPAFLFYVEMPKFGTKISSRRVFFVYFAQARKNICFSRNFM